MDVQEKNEGPVSNGSIGASNCHSNANENALKVRKPYTISKQREKWTEEEHQRFLEALKLYGRGWRQIKEHVGTKTAVQIRSHAQKFFSKVVRESCDCNESSINPIAIPPPRPKRKPLHPYPRKAVDSLKEISVARELERSPSSNLSFAEKESQSPTSILTAFSSDDQISAVSEQHHRCPSPISQAVDIPSTKLLSVRKVESYLPSKSNGGEEKGILSIETSSEKFPEDFLTLKFKPGPACKNIDNISNSPIKSIKLFGRTVMVTDDKKTSLHDFEVTKNNAEMLPSNHMDIDLSLGMDNNSDWNMSFGGAPTNNIKENHEKSAIWPIDSQTCWSLYQNVPYFYLAPSDQTNHDVEERMQNDNSVESSSADSCSGSWSNDMNENQSTEFKCDDRYQKGTVNGNESKKGFVPYKKCLARRDTSSALIDSEAREGWRAQVCLL